MTYDSTDDTKAHIYMVREFIEEARALLMFRQMAHDASKFEDPEKKMYDEWKPKIRYAEKAYGYGSKEYEDCLNGMGEALRHHFETNRHHPEHFENGINGMTLIDLIEMFCDWKAASVQYGTRLNLEANKKRFGMSDQLFEIFQNTVTELNW